LSPLKLKVAPKALPLLGFVLGLMVAFIVFSFDASEAVLLLALAGIVSALQTDHDAEGDGE
jgi:uncharacterized membrane protein